MGYLKHEPIEWNSFRKIAFCLSLKDISDTRDLIFHIVVGGGGGPCIMVS